MSQPMREHKYSLTLRKHIPSGRQYVPSDEIVTSVKWDDGEGLSWIERFQGLNEATAQAICEWSNPAVQQPAPALEQPSEGHNSADPKPPDEALLDRLPWKLFREGHEDGWVFSDLNDATVQQLRIFLEAQDKPPVAIGRFKYRFSGFKEQPRKFISRAPIEKRMSNAPTT